ncbi:asparagine synthetase B, partial [Methanobrevibacter sp. OttesenSCG-928-I08]|nr:asparagine synthetase B [Methanobrevibacter sp. OttesenSCG-928-I08]
MCAIIGFEGKLSGNEFISTLNLLNHRGPDASGIYLKNEIEEILIENSDLNINEDYSFGLGHNLLSIFNKTNVKKGFQPVKFNKLVLVFNGEIYNFKVLCDFLDLNYNLSDSFVLISLIDFFYSKTNDLLSSVVESSKLIDGDFVFAVYDGKNLAISRDVIGVKPLFYSITPEIKMFASEKGVFNNTKNVKSLKPGNILYNWEEIDLNENIWDLKFNITSDYIKDLEGLLKDSINKRVEGLDEVALILSGGVDSTLLGYLLKEVSNKTGLKVKLYVVGVPDSKDIYYSKMVADNLGFDLKILEITEKIVLDNLEEVVKFIGENNLMKIGVGMTMFLASKMIYEDNIKVAISGQGADELFAGYSRYLTTYKKGLKYLNNELRYDVGNLYHVNLERDDAATMKNSVELRLPYLDKKVIEYSLNIPVQYKIKSSDDEVKKRVLRNLAFGLGLSEELAYRPKKAAQYGSGIDKILRKKILKNIN